MVKKGENKLNERTIWHMWKICHERSRLNLRKESFPNSNEEIVYDYKAAAPAGRKIYAPAGTQDLTIEAKACGHEDT